MRRVGKCRKHDAHDDNPHDFPVHENLPIGLHPTTSRVVHHSILARSTSATGQTTTPLAMHLCQLPPASLASGDMGEAPNSDVAVVPCPSLPCPSLPCPSLPCPSLPCPSPAGLRRDRLLHRRKIGDGTHPARQPPTAAGEVAKATLARHLDGDGKDQVRHAG
jgi:hypothetical protein